MADFTDILRSGSFIRGYTGIQSGQPMGVIYIEDASDRLFWEKIVNRVCPGRYAVKPFSGAGTEGKRKLEKEYQHLHKDRLVGVDSDYDYLCPERNEYSDVLNNSPFVLHTFFYSRESYLHTPEAIEDLTGCIHLHDNINSNIIPALNRYSSIIYEAMLVFSWLHNRDQQQFDEKAFSGSIQLSSGVNILNSDLSLNETAFEGLNESVGHYINHHTQYIDDEESFESHREKLNERGINAENAVLFTNGHNLLDRVFLPIYELFIRNSQRNDIAWVSGNYPAAQIMDRQHQVRNHYKDRCKSATLIHHCESFHASIFWQRIADKLLQASIAA